MNWTDKIKVTNEDNMELMKRYPNNYFDLAIVDPPYGIGISSNPVRQKHSKKEWDTETPTKEYFYELQRVSKNQIVWGWNYMTDKLPTCKGFIYWNKLNHHDNRSKGELAYCSIDGLANHFEYMWDGNRYGFKGQKIQGVGKPTIRIHPTEKPTALYEWLLMSYGKEGDKILDTHLGSGSIAIACHNLGFELTACELDKEYYEASLKRFKQVTSQQSLF
jgi:site-specific DNA-methyltransferase (adenine-specific)